MQSARRNVRSVSVHTGNVVVDAALGSLRSGAADVDSALNHQIIDDISLVSGTTAKILHNLGRKLQGWVVVRCDITGVTFKDLQSTNTNPKEFLWLQCAGGDPTISLMVF